MEDNDATIVIVKAGRTLAVRHAPRAHGPMCYGCVRSSSDQAIDCSTKRLWDNAAIVYQSMYRRGVVEARLRPHWY